MKSRVEVASKNYLDFCPLDKRKENAEKIIRILKEDMENGRVLYNRLLNYSVTFVKNYHDGEDILSQFFLHLIEKGAITYKYNVNSSIDGNLYKWLHRGVRNLSISFTKNKRRLDVSYFFEKENEDYSFIDINWRKQKQEDSPDEKAIKKEISEIVSRNMPNLKMEYRDILTQRFFEHDSYQKISETQKIKIETAKSRVRAAKKKFSRLEEIAVLAN